MNLEIVKATSKAKLCKKEGEDFAFWIKNAYLRSDGTLTPAGLKSYEEAKNFTAVISVRGEILKETEKAVLIGNVLIKYNNTSGSVASCGVWMPKCAFKEIGECIKLLPKYKKMLQEKLVVFCYHGSLPEKIRF